MNSTKQLVKRQFSENAEKYVRSQVHSSGDSLALLVDLVEPKPNWRVLDVATGGGHNALAFAKLTGNVIVGDLTHRVVMVARKHIRASSAVSVSALQFDAEELPFQNESIDLLTSRIAPHHFPNVQKFLTEAARILRSGGVLAIADNVSPDDEKLSNYLNAFERLRDPSHHWAHSVHVWKQMVADAGLRDIKVEILSKDLDFLDWSLRTNAGETTIIKLESMLRQAPVSLGNLLNPREVGGKLVFSLTEAVIVAKKPHG